MSVTPIRLLGDPGLRTPAAPVADFDAELRRLVADLTDTMHAAGGAGLAAPAADVRPRFAIGHDDHLVAEVGDHSGQVIDQRRVLVGSERDAHAVSVRPTCGRGVPCPR